MLALDAWLARATPQQLLAAELFGGPAAAHELVRSRFEQLGARLSRLGRKSAATTVVRLPAAPGDTNAPRPRIAIGANAVRTVFAPPSGPGDRG